MYLFKFYFMIYEAQKEDGAAQLFKIFGTDFDGFNGWLNFRQPFGNKGMNRHMNKHPLIDIIICRRDY